MVFLFSAAKNCVRHAISTLDNSEAKVLILDGDSLGFVSLVFSHADAIRNKVFLTELITTTPPSSPAAAPAPAPTHGVDSRKHLTGVYFVRPTTENFVLLAQELRKPQLGKYRLCFTSTITRKQLEKLAEADAISNSVLGVEIINVDVAVLSDHVFSVELPTLGQIPYQENFLWTPLEQNIYARICQALQSAISLCLYKGGREPHANVTLGFTTNSDVCRRVATDLATSLEIDTDSNYATGAEQVFGTDETTASSTEDLGSGVQQLTVLVFDRREDLVTPLLNQWTYLAMTHELLGVTRNRVILPGGSEFVLSSESDAFFASHWNANFGELGDAVKRHVAEFQGTASAANSSEREMTSLSQMREFVERYPELRKLQGNVSKHVSLVHELSRLVQLNGLLETPPLEQILACLQRGVSPSLEMADLLDQKIKNPKIPRFEKFRLFLIFVAKCFEAGAEGSSSVLAQKLPHLKEELRKAGVELARIEEGLSALQRAFASTRENSRPPRRATQSAFLQFAKDVVQRGLRGNHSNIYLQHEPLSATLIEQFIKFERGGGRELSQQPFPLNSITLLPGSPFPDRSTSLSDRSTLPPVPPMARSNSQKVLLLFVVGGATYEEVYWADSKGREFGQRVVLGATTIHNTKSFLADLIRTNNALPTPQTFPSPLPPNSRPSTFASGSGSGSASGAGAAAERGGQRASSLDREAELALKQEFLREKCSNGNSKKLPRSRLIPNDYSLETICQLLKLHKLLPKNCDTLQNTRSKLNRDITNHSKSDQAVVDRSKNVQFPAGVEEFDTNEEDITTPINSNLTRYLDRSNFSSFPVTSSISPLPVTSSTLCPLLDPYSDSSLILYSARIPKSELRIETVEIGENLFLEEKRKDDDFIHNPRRAIDHSRLLEAISSNSSLEKDKNYPQLVGVGGLSCIFVLKQNDDFVYKVQKNNFHLALRELHFSHKLENDGSSSDQTLLLPRFSWLSVDILWHSSSGTVLRVERPKGKIMTLLNLLNLFQTRHQYKNTAIPQIAKQRKILCGIKSPYTLASLIGIMLFRAIRQIHKIGLIHGDVKPENFLIGKRVGSTKKKTAGADKTLKTDVELFGFDYGRSLDIELTKTDIFKTRNKKWSFGVDFQGISDCLYALIYGNYYQPNEQSGRRRDFERSGEKSFLKEIINFRIKNENHSGCQEKCEEGEEYDSSDSKYQCWGRELGGNIRKNSSERQNRDFWDRFLRGLRAFDLEADEFKKSTPDWRKSLSLEFCNGCLSMLAPAPLEDFYDVLNVPANASLELIRSSYKQLALRHHPDKNREDPESAKRLFVELQEAYETLSDAHERAWYDSHKTQILKGEDDSTAEDPSGSKIKIFSYFTTSCFDGFDDQNPKSFFNVYRNLFDLIHEEECNSDRSKQTGVDNLNSGVGKVPCFGSSSSSVNEVRQFYRYWSRFESAKEFAYANKWRMSEAPNRWTRRQMENENKRARREARREFNEAVTALVDFVRKRDPRCAALLAAQAAENRRVAEAEAAEALRKREVERQQSSLRRELAKQAEEERWRDIEIHKLSGGQTFLADEEPSDPPRGMSPSLKTGRVSGRDFERSFEASRKAVDKEDEEKADQEKVEQELEVKEDGIAEGSGVDFEEGTTLLLCEACRKTFRSLQQLRNHEMSKKHKIKLHLLLNA